MSRGAPPWSAGRPKPSRNRPRHRYGCQDQHLFLTRSSTKYYHNGESYPNSNIATGHSQPLPPPPRPFFVKGSYSLPRPQAQPDCVLNAQNNSHPLTGTASLDIRSLSRAPLDGTSQRSKTRSTHWAGATHGPTNPTHGALVLRITELLDLLPDNNSEQPHAAVTGCRPTNLPQPFVIKTDEGWRV